MEYLKTLKWFCCLIVFLIFKDFCGAVSSSLGKFCPTPGEYDHHFSPGQGIRQKNCLGGRDYISTVAYGLHSDPEKLSDSEQTILYEQLEMPSQSQRPK